MEALAKDKRELIKTKNGYFKYTLSANFNDATTAAAAGSLCEWTFHLPPLNEMGFSDRYNQALVQIRSIQLASSAAASANGRFGENAVWFTSAGGFEGIENGIQLVSSIPCRNQSHLAAVNAAGWTHNNGIFAQTLSQKLSPKTAQLYSTNVNAVDTSLVLLGTHENLLQGTTAGAAASNRYQVNSKDVWYYETDKDIWTGGSLCGVPMGGEVTFKVLRVFDGSQLQLSSNGAHVDGSGTAMSVELEIQLLPNPTAGN